MALPHEEDSGQDRDQKGPLDKFLRPRTKPRRQQQPCMPQTAFRSVNLCQQLLSAELGWPAQRSLHTWREVQARQQLVQLQLPPVWHSPPSTHQRQEVCCLELQQQHARSSSRSPARLAAVGYSCGILHIVKLTDLLDTVQAAEAAEAAAGRLLEDPGGGPGTHSNTAAAAAGVLSAPVPTGCVWSVDLQDRLLSACWSAAGEVPELATAGAQGVKIRRFVEGRHHEYPLKLKSGGAVDKPGQVKYMEPGAAYQLAAARPGGLVLWDCRAASRAVAEMPTSNTTQLLQPLPGGDVLLAAAADGQMALYDVRRMSSNASCVINFGGSRADQQLIARYNVPARADDAAAAAAGASSNSSGQASSAAAAAAGGSMYHHDALAASSSSSLGVPFRIYPFFRDVAVNPADCNLVAFVRPDLQVGVFDLYHNKVLQQVCVTEAIGSADASVLVGCQRQAAARGCWDSQGRVLYTHGLLRQCHAGSGVAQLQPTLAAVDFGSWTGRQHRRDSSWIASDLSSSSRNARDAVGVSSSRAAGDIDMEVDESAGDRSGGADSSNWSGSVVCKGGQVVHLPMLHHAVPTELALGGCNGELLVGTLQGDVMCVH